MTLLHIIDTLCDVTTKQADLLRELVTDLEHMNQVSEEVKNYYREKLDSKMCIRDRGKTGCPNRS